MVVRASESWIVRPAGAAGQGKPTDQGSETVAQGAETRKRKRIGQRMLVAGKGAA